MNKKKFKQLSVRQINILIVAFAVILVFIIIWLYIFVPFKTNSGKLSSQLAEVDKRIKEIETFVPKGATIQDQITSLKSELTAVSQKVPEEEGEIVTTVMDFVRTFNLKIEYTKTLDRQLLLDEKDQKFVIEGKRCEIVPLSVKIKGTYGEIINLVSSFRKSIPAHISVVRLLIESPKDDSGKVDAILDINVYVMTKNG